MRDNWWPVIQSSIDRMNFTCAADSGMGKKSERDIVSSYFVEAWMIQLVEMEKDD